MAINTTAKQHLPECFERKIEVDKQIAKTYDKFISREGNVAYVSDFKAMKAAMKPLKIEQGQQRYSCQESIKKANGP